ncbi:MAG: hypothetical protein ACFFC1_18545 [Promethearchaeota archaeon]
MNFNDVYKEALEELKKLENINVKLMKENEKLFKILKDMICDKDIPWKFRRKYYLKLINYLESEVKK